MWAAFQLLAFLVDVLCFWRFFICLAAASIPAIVLHDQFPEQWWVWFISIPLVLIGGGSGVWWQVQSERK